jgi:hypothetical protein
MGNLGTRSALVAGVIALAIGIGAGMIFASRQAGAAFAQGGETEFVGVVETLPEIGAVGTWQVSGRTVQVSEQTRIELEGQALATGLRVEVEGIGQPDGSVVASEIEVRENGDDDGGATIGDDDDTGGITVPNAVPAARDDD